MILYAQRKGHRVGYCRLRQTTCGDLEISYLTVNPEWRGKGIASQLLQRAKQVTQKAGVDLIAFIEPDGTGLDAMQEVAWLKRHGFKHQRWYDLSNKRLRTLGQYVRHKPRKRPVMIWTPNNNLVDLHG